MIGVFVCLFVCLGAEVCYVLGILYKEKRSRVKNVCLSCHLSPSVCVCVRALISVTKALFDIHKIWYRRSLKTVEVKVKVTLEQATKTQRWSRGIALFFL